MTNDFYGSFILVLHSHIPYVLNHDRMEEEWLMEGVAETYIPLLDMLNELISEGVSPQITISFTPVLAEQLKTSQFKKKFKQYCLMKMEYSIIDQSHFLPKDRHISWLAKLWEDYYFDILDNFKHKYNEDIIESFKKLQDEGHIEIMTSAATHSYFPAIPEDTSIQAQIKMSIKSYEENFGMKPRGFWLPECGYRPSYWWKVPTQNHYFSKPYPRKGVEEFLSENDLRYFIVDHHQMQKAWPPDLNKTPLDSYYVIAKRLPKRPVSVLARDVSISQQVWQHEVGYPGDGLYLDFHKKHAGGNLRYWRITDRKLDMAYKKKYYPDEALLKRVKNHAGHYKWLIAQSLRANYYNTGRAKMLMTAFDTELFGHWWFEGPRFLYYLIKWINADPNIKTETCSDYLDRSPSYNWIALPESSWGANFDNSTWINRELDWVWDKIVWAEREMQYLAKEFAHRKDDENLMRILKQAIRELMILEASDWEFMITNWSTRDHAEYRVMSHYNNFYRLSKMAWDYGHGREVKEGEWYFLWECEEREKIFNEPEIDWYAKLDYPPAP